MISSMHRRSAGLVTLLGLAVAATSRPALAQQADSDWFDDPAPPPAPAVARPQPRPPAAADSTPQMPAYGPQGQPLSPDQGAAQGQGPPQADQGAPPGAPQDDIAETDPRALSEFRPALDPYGTWVEDQKYGTLWVPNRDAVGDDFAPYVSAGHWALTEDGDWTWQSDYPFGGVVFHYGRWVWVPGTGWAWVAGRRYANAWVTWRVPTDDYAYVGWAPMPPAWGWYGGSALALWWYPPAPYVFCPSGYAFSNHVHSYILHDRYVIHDVAGHTRNYAGNGHLAASPRVLPANSVAPRGPTLQSAHIPASAAPASRIASRSSFSGAAMNASFRANPYVRSDSRGAAARPYGASSYAGSRPYANPSSYARPSGYPAATSGSMRPSSYATPSRAYSAPSRAYSAPSVAPRASSGYSYSAPAPRYAAPARSYSPPAMHYAAPARSYSPPAMHYAAPARSYSPPATHDSAPARSYSGPSFHSHSRR